MKCPVDNETLVMADRNGVEIDYCPKCRGVWLDRGELDKIIERSGVSAGALPERPVREQQSYRRDDDEDDDDRYDRSKPYPKKKRGSFLEELFDFG